MTEKLLVAANRPAPKRKKARKPRPLGPSKLERQTEEALRKNAGIKAYAAEALGISRQAMQLRVDRSLYLQAVMAELDETLLDLAEGNVAKDLKAGDGKMTRWFLTQKGKARGFGPKLSLELSDDAIDAITRAAAQDPDRLRALRDQLDQEA